MRAGVWVCVCGFVCVDILSAFLELHFVRQSLKNFFFVGDIQSSLKLGSCANYSCRVTSNACLPLTHIEACISALSKNTCVCLTHKQKRTAVCS